MMVTKTPDTAQATCGDPKNPTSPYRSSTAPRPFAQVRKRPAPAARPAKTPSSAERIGLITRVSRSTRERKINFVSVYEK